MEKKWFGVGRYGIAAASVTLAIAARIVLDPVVGEKYVFAPTLVAILLVASYAGLGPAVAAVVLGALGSIFLLLPPRGTFHLAAVEQQLGLILYLLTGTGMALLSGSMHAAQRALRDANDQLEVRVRERTEELRLSAERFRQIAENIREVFWLDDVALNQALYVSPAYETIWGRSCASHYEAPGAWLSAIHPVERSHVAETFQALTTTGCYDLEYRLIRPDGSVRWIHDRRFPVCDDKGVVYRIAGVAEDITEHREAETDAKVQQSRLEGIVNSAMDGIITVDEEQRIILFNLAAERMFACSAVDALGQRVEQFIPERYRALHGEHMRRFAQSDTVACSMGVPGSIFGVRSGGEEFPLEASISQVEVEGNKLFTVTCRDITERVNAEEARQKLEALLQQSQKLEAFGQLAGGVAHDFNNLLTVILGCSEWLLLYHPAEPEAAGMIADIMKAGERAAGLTRQLLAFSRQQVIEPRVLDLNSTLTDIEKLLSRLIGEDIELTVVLQPELWSVKIDPGQIEQVIMNLAVNARDAMPQGGKLTIETRNVELDESYTNVHAEVRPGHFVLLAVSDTGSGMPPEVKARVFEPFFTTKGIGKGTGLGLAVVHGIVKQGGGSIEVYSEPATGTTIKLYLPVAEEAPASQCANTAQTPTGSETILLVEDEDGVRDIAALSLEGLGYTVFQASGGEAALHFMAEHDGKIDLLLTDVVMPETSGRALAEALCARHDALRVLFVSGYTDDAIVRHGVLQAEVAFLQKPFTLNALARKVREVLDA